MALCTAAAKNFSEIFAIRFFLGIFESAMLPGVVSILLIKGHFSGSESIIQGLLSIHILQT